MANKHNPAACLATDIGYADEGSYPVGLDEPCAGRHARALGNHFGLTRYGVNLVELAPGAWSAQRHWHTHEDELIYVLSGELVLVTARAEQLLSTGMTAGFTAGVEDGHHLVNRSDSPAVYLEIGDRNPLDDCHYPDIDLFYTAVGGRREFQHKDGTPY